MQEIPAVDRLIWCNGELVPWRDVTVHVLSHSLQRGSLVFDYMSVHQTPRGVAVFRMDAHIRRLLHSCELMGLPIDADPSTLAAAIGQTVRINPGARAVKISAFLASLEVDVVPLDRRVSVVIAAYDPAADLLAKLPGAPSKRLESLRLRLQPDARSRRETIVSPQAKVSAAYLPSMIAKTQAVQDGFDEILLMDEEGHVVEGPTTNVFVVDQEGVLMTPPERRVLHGVTRASVLELADAMEIPLREVDISSDQLLASREVFITGTTAGVLPVASVNGQTIGEHLPGPATQRLGERLSRVARGEDPNFEHWLTYVEEEASA